MSKPWSQAGIAAEWSEWRTLFRNYAIGVVVVAVMLFVAGFSCGRRGATRSDPVTAAEAATAQRLESALRLSEQRRESVTVANRTLAERLARDSTAAAATHRTSLSLEAGISIDTAHRFTPVASIDSAVPVDTVAYADIQRPNDDRHYSVPKFFALSYLALRADRNAAYITAHDQQAIIGGLMAKSAVSDSLFALHDSLDASNARRIAALTAEHQPWCQFKCGVITTLVTLTAGAIAISAVHR